MTRRAGSVREAIRAYASGGWTVLSRPWLVLAVYLATLVVALPFAIWLGSQLRNDLGRSQIPRDDAPHDLDPEWWAEYRRRASGLADTLTPNIVGSAAPLDNLSRLADAGSRSWSLVGPLAVYVLVSAWVMAGVLHALCAAGAKGVAAFTAGANRYVARVVAVDLVALAAVALAYAAAHPILFGPVLGAVVAWLPGETPALLGRAGLYAAFGALLVVIGVTADYARAISVGDRALGPGAVLQATVSLMRERWVTVVTVVSLAIVAWAVLLAGYTAIDVWGGTRVGGWRAVALGQAYLVGRAALRVIHVSAQVRIVRDDGASGAQEARRVGDKSFF